VERKDQQKHHKHYKIPAHEKKKHKQTKHTSRLTSQRARLLIFERREDQRLSPARFRGKNIKPTPRMPCFLLCGLSAICGFLEARICIFQRTSTIRNLALILAEATYL
jgi:hypothetical protein